MRWLHNTRRPIGHRQVASLNVVDHKPGQWAIRLWGDTGHLDRVAGDEVDGRIV
jgi:hypothetical protein